LKIGKITRQSAHPAPRGDFLAVLTPRRRDVACRISIGFGHHNVPIVSWVILLYLKNDTGKHNNFK